MAETVEKKAGIFKRIWAGLSILFASKVAMVGLVLVLFWVLAAIFAPFLTPGQLWPPLPRCIITSRPGV